MRNTVGIRWRERPSSYHLHSTGGGHLLPDARTPAAMVDTYTQLPNPRTLSFNLIPLGAAFQNPNSVVDGKIFPSSEHISLESMIVGGGDWSPPVTLLTCRASSPGGRLDILAIADSPLMLPEVVDGIRGMARELNVEIERSDPPHDPSRTIPINEPPQERTTWACADIYPSTYMHIAGSQLFLHRISLLDFYYTTYGFRRRPRERLPKGGPRILDNNRERTVMDITK